MSREVKNFFRCRTPNDLGYRPATVLKIENQRLKTENSQLKKEKSMLEAEVEKLRKILKLAGKALKQKTGTQKFRERIRQLEQKDKK